MKTWLRERDWKAFGLFIAMLALNYVVITAVHAADARAAPVSATSGFGAEDSGGCTPLIAPVDGRAAPLPTSTDGELI